MLNTEKLVIKEAERQSYFFPGNILPNAGRIPNNPAKAARKVLMSLMKLGSARTESISFLNPPSTSTESSWRKLPKGSQERVLSLLVPFGPEIRAHQFRKMEHQGVSSSATRSNPASLALLI